MIDIDRNKALVTLGSALALFASGAAQAAGHEEAPTAVSAVSKTEIEQLPKRPIDELVTTARRTEENVLEVPLAIKSIGADEIKAAQITDLSDVAAQTPGFSVQNFFSQDLTVPTIRGVSQIDIFGDPNVPVFVDGIYVSSQVGINFSFLDVERIEVLRGPQPAYFGYLSFSGAVNFVTPKPSDELTFNGEVTLGSDEKQRIGASLAGPLVQDKLSGRISAMYDDFGGTYSNQNPAVDQDIGGRKYKTLAGSLFFTPTDSLSAQWNMYVSEDSIDPGAQSTVAANCEPRVGGAKLLNFCGDVPTRGKNDLSTIPGETGQTRDVVRTSLNVDWETAIGTFSSLTGYSVTKSEILASTNWGAQGVLVQYQSTDPGPFFGNAVKTFNAPFLQASAGEGELKDFSQEFRYTTDQDNRWRFSGGAYFRRTVSKSPNFDPSYGGFHALTSSLPADFISTCPCIQPVPGNSVAPTGGFDSYFLAQDPEFSHFSWNKTRLWSVFSSFAFDFTDQWTGYIEGRYSDFTQNQVSQRRDFDGQDEQVKDDFFNWRASLEYHPNDLSTIYGSIATGSKQAGSERFQLTTVPSPDADPLCPDPLDFTNGECVDGRTITNNYGQEENTTYELGYKGAFRDGRMIVDGAVYYIDWTDVVIPQIAESYTTPGGQVKPVVAYSPSRNAGKAEITGMEVALINDFTDNFSGGAGFSYNKAEFKRGKIESFVDFPSFAPDGDMGGQTLLRQPELQANVNATYRAQFRGDWDWYTRGDVNYQGRWYVGLPNQARIPSRFRANLRIGLESERYTVELWANNVFDDDTVEAAFRDVYFSNVNQDGTDDTALGQPIFSTTFFPFRLSTQLPQRRTVGITLRGRF